jgi:hypothetical protein
MGRLAECLPDATGPEFSTMWQTMIVLTGLQLCQAISPDTAPPPQVQVERLVRQLDDDKASLRKGAEEALIQLGPNILDLLPSAEAPGSAERRERLARVRTALQKARAEQAVTASLVSVAGTVSVRDALQSISGQSGNKLFGYEEVDKQVELKLEKVPFWVALDQILDAGGLALDPYAADERGLAVVAGAGSVPRHNARACYQGIFRFEPTLVSTVRDLRSPELGVMRVRVTINWEPRTKPILLSQRLKNVTAVDDLGKTLAVQGVDGTLSASLEGDIPFVELEYPFALPDRQAKRIATLTGTLDALLPGQVERFEFDNLDKANQVAQKRAGVTVTLQQVRQNDEAQEVFVRVQFASAAGALESHRGWVYKNLAYLTSQDGERLEFGGQRLMSQDENSVGIAFVFAPERPMSEYRFVYETPAMIVSQPVTFELKDIELP